MFDAIGDFVKNNVVLTLVLLFIVLFIMCKCGILECLLGSSCNDYCDSDSDCSDEDSCYEESDCEDSCAPKICKPKILKCNPKPKCKPVRSCNKTLRIRGCPVLRLGSSEDCLPCGPRRYRKSRRSCYKRKTTSSCKKTC